MTGLELHHRIVNSLTDRFFGGPLIEPVERAAYVECMVQFALGEEWTLAAQWSPWDLTHDRSGVRLEVKQATALQLWAQRPCDFAGTSTPFHVASVAGVWDELTKTWLPYRTRSRAADIFVFAWHPGCDLEQVDQRVPEQWEFHVVPERSLAHRQKTISASKIRRRWPATPYSELAERVAEAAAKIPRRLLKTNRVRELEARREAARAIAERARATAPADGTEPAAGPPSAAQPPGGPPPNNVG